MADLSYFKNAERPVAELWIRDKAGTLIDFSTGYTFVLKIGHPDLTALLSKSSGIAGAAGAGVEPTGTPNVVVTWTAGELNLTPARYRWDLVATTGGLDRTFSGTIQIKPVVG
jgi:hypothetical protein